MLPDSTTTIGEGESVATERPFHSMKAVDRTRAKFRAWARSCRGERVDSDESMLETKGKRGLKGVEEGNWEDFSLGDGDGILRVSIGLFVICSPLLCSLTLQRCRS